MPTRFTILPATAERWVDLEALFASRGCSQARGCWCMYYRTSGAMPLRVGETIAQARKRRMRALVAGKAIPGLLAYAGDAPVGWVSLASRSEFLKLRRSSVLKPVDDADVWSIVCFVVAGEWRRRGVAAALLRGAIAHATRCGARTLEAYPVDRVGPGRDDALWFGTKAMYDRAGFVEVARRKPDRPIVRLRLGPAARRQALPPGCIRTP
jgi:ribosomal protein S18 acetylase RimI-like enzyme